MHEAILNLGSLGKSEIATRKGQALLLIYDELGCSSWLYQRTYYDLFQVAITKRKSVQDGRKYIRESHAALLAYTGDEKHPTVRRFKALIDAPHNHRNYLALER